MSVCVWACSLTFTSNMINDIIEKVIMTILSTTPKISSWFFSLQNDKQRL